MKTVKTIFTLLSLCVVFQISAQQKPSYKYRKYGHVKTFYERLAKSVTDVCVEYKVPPAMVLSIMSLESGWGKGYVGQITGNFLSLNAKRSETELPSLRMPKHKKTGKYLLLEEDIHNTPEHLILWSQRPASLKKDYRPFPLKGTKTNLDYFLKHPEELTKANLANVKDFVSRFISAESNIKAYREAREMIDKAIESKGVEVLFEDQLNIKFIYAIGGKPNSYNFRKKWPLRVLNIYKNIGANELSKQLYLQKKDFAEVW